MKYFYSYYPTKNIQPEDIFFNLLSIKLSSTILRRLNKTVGIYANCEFIELLKKYEIELDFYEDIGNEIKSISCKKLFGICKIYSNMIQAEPFMQIDTDLFLFDNFNFDLLETSQISFYLTEIIDHTALYPTYKSFKETYLDTFNVLCKEFPDLVYEKHTNPLIAYNCAMVGGNNWEVFPTIYEPIFNAIKNNHKFMQNLDRLHPMPVLEQHIITGHLNQIGYNLSNINFVTKGNSFSSINEYIEYLGSQLLNAGTPCGTGTKLSHIKDFGGVMHLTGTKGTLRIQNLVYEILKLYDPVYVNWLEQKFGKQYDFQNHIQ